MFLPKSLTAAIAIASACIVPASYATLSCDLDAPRISNIQGTGDSSPLVNTVQTVTGIVTLVYQDSTPANNVFFIQQQSNGSDLAGASRGLAVAGYTGAMPTVGQTIVVQGTIVENYGLTTLNGIVGEWNDCGAASVNVDTLLTDAVIPDDANLEAFESMLVRLKPKTNDNGLYITNNYSMNRYGELQISSGAPLVKPTNKYTAGSQDAENLAAYNAVNSILVDDRNSAQNPGTISYLPDLSYNQSGRIGSRMDEVVGVVDYTYGKFRISPTKPLQLDTDNAAYGRTISVLPPVVDAVRVANFNVLNYFNGLPNADGTINWAQSDLGSARGANNETEFVRQQSKIVTAMARMNADVIGLQEMENDGWEEGISAISSLVNALNASHEKPVEKTYRYVATNSKYAGTDVIKVALIYNSAAVTPVGDAIVLEAYPFDATTAKHRPPLLQTFKVNDGGAEFTAVVNHFKSKGSGCTDMADPEDTNMQGNCNRQRVAAAETLGRYLEQNYANQDVVLLGDLNAYGKEDPVLVLTNDDSGRVIEASRRNNDGNYYSEATEFRLGYVNAAPNAVSYAYQGEVGALDHALVSPTLASKVITVTDWHINSMEAAILDYNQEYKSSTDNYGQTWDQRMVRADSPVRSSDHDPVLIDLLLSGSTTDGNDGDEDDNKPTIIIIKKDAGSFGWPMIALALMAVAGRLIKRRKH